MSRVARAGARPRPAAARPGRRGKPETPLLATDCVAVDARGRVLLIRRGNPPFKGLWALPGGFVDIGETVEAACRRELEEETGIAAGKLELVGVYSDPRRDPRGHTCSVVFLARIARATPRAGDDAAAAEWVEDWSKAEIAFDHAAILADAARMLRRGRAGKARANGSKSHG
jgi:8-oxo-dGTP diphosphatase